MVDGQRLMTFLKPLPTTSEGRDFELRTKVLGVYDKGKAGSVVETETVLVEKGEVYTRSIGSAFMVGQGGWGGPKGEFLYIRYPQLLTDIGPSTVNFPPPQNRKPDATHTLQTTPESAHLYRYTFPFHVPCPQKPPSTDPLLPQAQRRLQPLARNPRTRRQNGLRRRHHAWSLLMEQRVSWLVEGARGQ